MKQEGRTTQKEHTRATQQEAAKNEFDERWDKNTRIKKKLQKRIWISRIDERRKG